MLFQQSAHVAFLYAPHLVPAQVVKLSYAFDRHFATELSDPVFEPLCEPGRLGQHCKGLALHGFAIRTGNPAVLEFKVYAGCPGIQVSDHVSSSVSKA